MCISTTIPGTGASILIVRPITTTIIITARASISVSAILTTGTAGTAPGIVLTTGTAITGDGTTPIGIIRIITTTITDTIGAVMAEAITTTSTNT